VTRQFIDTNPDKKKLGNTYPPTLVSVSKSRKWNSRKNCLEIESEEYSLHE